MTLAWLAAFWLLLAIDIQSADAVTISTVPVGNLGNANDPTDGNVFEPGVQNFGAVGYAYSIGKYEVTNNQYAEFLNAVDPTGSNSLGLYDTDPRGFGVPGIVLDAGAADGMKYAVVSGLANFPRSNVSLADIYRFANWLHNGQGNGDTESGAYTLPAGQPTNVTPISRNPDAKWFVPNRNEWYKAAYHKNDGAAANYWEYPTSSDTEPFSDQPPGSDAPVQSNTANFFKNDSLANGYNDGYAVTGSTSLIGGQNYLTEVGAYTASVSPYGTFDQGGNLAEWIEEGGSRGGAMHEDDGLMAASQELCLVCVPGDFRFGFRVATIVPEPSTPLLAGMALLGAVMRRRARS